MWFTHYQAGGLEVLTGLVGPLLVTLLSTTAQGIAEICDGRKDLYLAETLYTRLTQLRRRFHRTQGESEPSAVESVPRRDELEEISRTWSPFFLDRAPFPH